jgi:hypothetical protein
MRLLYRSSIDSESLRLGVSREMHFHALRQKTLPSPLPPPGQSGAPTLGAHTRTKTMLLFPGSFGSLQGALHKEKSR